MLCLNISEIIYISLKDIDYGCITDNISIPEAICLLEYFVLDDLGYIENAYQWNQVCICYFNNSIEAKKIKTKIVLIGEKN